MSDPSERPRKSSRRDIDISTSGTRRPIGWRANLLIWSGCLFSVSLGCYFGMSVWWPLVGLLSLLVLFFTGRLAWILLIKRGVLTWRPLTLRPAKLMAAGDAARAEQACVRAIARANRFRPDDHRRGLMLCEIAMFIKLQGRYDEALAMYEESMAILSRDRKREPLDYFVVLNNYGICFIHLKNYDAAQRILEKAIDLTLTTRKGEANQIVIMPLPQVQALQFVLHLNLAFLFMEMNELGEAELQLREADALEPLLSKKIQAGWHDHYVGICSLWEFESGNLAEAEKEIAQVGNPDYPVCLRVRALLHMARQEFPQAEAALRKHQVEEKKKGTLHRPEMLKPMLEFAEALFGQGKHDEALTAVNEARAIVADFRLPGDAAWRSALKLWKQRASELHRPELAESLQNEIDRLVTAPTQAITILDKFKAQAPG